MNNIKSCSICTHKYLFPFKHISVCWQLLVHAALYIKFSMHFILYVWIRICINLCQYILENEIPHVQCHPLTLELLILSIFYEKVQLGIKWLFHSCNQKCPSDVLEFRPPHLQKHQTGALCPRTKWLSQFGSPKQNRPSHTM